MKTSAPALFAALVLAAANARAVTTLVSFTPNLAIPDNNAVGVADFRTITSPVKFITAIEVTLEITGGFNGDYYVYLQHGSGSSILLNRPGRTAADDLGYADSGAFVTFAQGALGGDVHTYQTLARPNGGPLIGTFEPDGRHIDPLLATDTAPRLAGLPTFSGMDANGTWTLFAADRSSGQMGTLSSWSLNITGVVPEPDKAVLLLSAAFFGLVRRRRSTGAGCA